MDICFLGTGSSIGLPMIAFEHEGVDLDDSRNWRSRPSIHVVMGGHHIQVDAGQEFRLQCIDNAIDRIDSFILTHEHSDHVLGMEDLRRFCTLKGGEALPVYSSPVGLQRVGEVFPYAIGERPTFGGYAAFSLREIGEVFETPGGTVRTVKLPHGTTQTLGLIFEEADTGKRFVYYTDCHEVPLEARELARGADVVVLDALYYKTHRAHMSVDQAVEVAQDIAAPLTYFTHLTYPVDHAKLERSLSKGIRVAYDGLKLKL